MIKNGRETVRFSMVFSIVNDLISELVVYKDNMNTVLMAGISCYQKLAADCVGRLAIKARTRLGAGGVEPETLCVYRCGNVPCPFKSGVNILCDLVHSDDKHNLFRTVSVSRNPV